MSSEQVLYVVATPIGHRDDMSSRAIEVLRQVDRIYAEDTRHSLTLLRHHGIDAKLQAFHEHNEQAQADLVVEHLREGHSAALISDAGTPLISDPGYRLVRACQLAGVRVSPVPGPCALVCALSVCGLPTDRFQYVGFAPARRSARKVWLQPLAKLTHTQVLYESPHRILDCLEDIVEVYGASREMCLARELTKRFETIVRAEAAEVLARVRADANQQRGEFVIVIGGAGPSNDEGPEGSVALQLDATLTTLLSHLPVKTAAKVAAELFSLNKRDVYDRALLIQKK